MGNMYQQSYYPGYVPYDPMRDPYIQQLMMQRYIQEQQRQQQAAQRKKGGLTEVLEGIATDEAGDYLLGSGASSGVSAETAALAEPVLNSMGISTGVSATPTASMMSGGTLMSDGSILAPTMTDAATGAATTSLNSAAPAAQSSLAAAAPYLGAAGAALGMKGMYDATKMPTKKKGAIAGGLSGAGAGLGLGMAAPLVGLGPLGWGALGLMALGGGALGGGMGLMAHKSTKQREAERWGKALEAAPNAEKYYEQLKANEESQANYKGKVNKNYANDAVGMYDGKWVNNKFAKSRNEADLQAEDIWGGQDFFMNFGDDWLGKFSENERRAVANELLKNKMVDEKKGGIYFTDDDAAKKMGYDLIEQMRSGKKPAEKKPQMFKPGASIDPGFVQPGISDLLKDKGPKNNIMRGLAAIKGGRGESQEPTVWYNKTPGMFESKEEKPTVDAGTLKRWRENKSKGVKGYSGR